MSKLTPKTTLNSENDITKRMLEAFSVNSLRSIFTIDTSIRSQNDVISEVLKRNTISSINNILFTNFNLLKQHVYFFETKGVFPNNYLEEHPDIFNITKKSSGHKIYYFLFKENYNFFNVASNKIQVLTFARPVKLEIKKLVATVSVNILERNVGSILNTKILNLQRTLSDKNILDSITTHDHKITYFKHDLQKGIKYLWENDVIDALKVKFKKSKSTSSEVMDEEHLLKVQYPDTYNEIISSPLDTTIFKYIEDSDLVRYFTANPREGYISFSTYPTSTDGIDKIVQMIFQNN